MTPEVRKLARELAQGSIVTDALAQFIGQVIEEIHTTKIKPLEAEAARLREKVKADVAAEREACGQLVAGLQRPHFHFATLEECQDHNQLLWRALSAIHARAALTTEEG